MPRATCPACGRAFRLEEDEAVLDERVSCPNCDALLEVIDENPLTLEELDDVQRVYTNADFPDDAIAEYGSQ